jgi:hypothetical protein
VQRDKSLNGNFNVALEMHFDDQRLLVAEV